jgi:hypothetical protein
MTQGEETGLARGPSLLIAAVRTRSTEGGGEGLEGEPGRWGNGWGLLPVAGQTSRGGFASISTSVGLGVRDGRLEARVVLARPGKIGGD